MRSHAHSFAFVALLLGCSASSDDTGTGSTVDSSSQPDIAIGPSDTLTPFDTTAPSTDSSVDTSKPDTPEPDCASPGGPKCKAGTVCVPDFNASSAVALPTHHCALPNGELGGGCLAACMGTSRCKAGSCYKYSKTGADTCGWFCDLTSDCKGAAGICCKKAPDVTCMDGSCIGGKCDRPGMCAPC